MSSPNADSERRPLIHRNTSRGSSGTSTNSHRSDPSAPAISSPNIFHSPDQRHHVFRTRFASAAILLSLVFERIAFYGLAGNLVLFLNKSPYNWVSYFAIDASLYFFGLSFVMSLIGGWLADSVLGRFKTMLISLLIYLVGYSLMPWLSHKTSVDDTRLPLVCWDNRNTSIDTDTDYPFDEPCAGPIFITLTIIAIGAGFVKANIAPFGSDQVAREGQQATLSFFNWFYWSVNIGALVGLLAITYVQQQDSFFHGFIVSAACLGLSTFFFVAGRCCYFVRPPDGSVLSNMFRIIREAFRRKRLRRQQLVIKTFSRARLGHGIREVDEADPDANISFLDYAKHRHGGIFHDSMVDDVKQLKKIFAVFAVLIPYWIVYFQMETTFLIQGLHMRLVQPFTEHMLTSILPWNNITNATSLIPTTQVPAAWFFVFDVIVLIIFLPLVDRVIYPYIERKTGSPVSISRRILLGMVFAMFAMTAAGILEHFRLQAFWPNLPNSNNSCINSTFNQKIGDTIYQAADMSVLWQIPQYSLVGLSEVFTSVAGLQFAVTVAPRSMKGIIMGLFYMFSGIGSLLGTAIITSFSSNHIWFDSSDHGNINCRFGCDGSNPLKPTNLSKYDDMKSCHLDYFFLLLAGVELLGALLFVLVAHFFQLDEHHRQSRSSQHLLEATSDFMDPVKTTPVERAGPVVRGKLPHSIQGYQSDTSP